MDVDSVDQTHLAGSCIALGFQVAGGSPMEKPWY